LLPEGREAFKSVDGFRSVAVVAQYRFSAQLFQYYLVVAAIEPGALK